MISKEAVDSVERLEYSKMLKRNSEAFRRGGALSVPSVKTANSGKDFIPMKFARLTLKAAISIPFLIAWIYWLSLPAEIPVTLIQIPVFVTIVSYISVLIWLTICSINNLAIVLCMGTYSMFFVAPLALASVVCSIYSGNTTVGLLLATGGTLSIIDIVLHFYFFPPVKVSAPAAALPKDVVPETTSDFYRSEGPLFEYVPLKGGPRVLLRKYSDFKLIEARTSKASIDEEEESEVSVEQSESRVMPSTSRQSEDLDENKDSDTNATHH